MMNLEKVKKTGGLTQEMTKMQTINLTQINFQKTDVDYDKRIDVYQFYMNVEFGNEILYVCSVIFLYMLSFYM